MGKTPDQQKTLEHIWHTLHEEQHHSSEAARVANKNRQQEKDPTSEMALELAAMEFVTAGAAARDSSSYGQAHPLFVQAANVALDTFPLDPSEDAARNRGNAWDKVYGEKNAQIEMLRNYFHLIRRLELIIPTEQFRVYSLQLWQLLLRLSTEFQDEISIHMLRIEHDTYPHAKDSFEKFLAELGKKDVAKNTDSSRAITISARMMNRALQEGDYDMTLKAFTVALNELRSDRNKLSHFARQIAVNIRADKNIRETNKLRRWQQEAKDSDLSALLSLLELTFVGLGNDRVESIHS